MACYEEIDVVAGAVAAAVAAAFRSFSMKQDAFSPLLSSLAAAAAAAAVAVAAADLSKTSPVVMLAKMP